MTHNKAKELVNKSMKVILSCKTLEQLNAAVRYAGLVYKKLGQEIGLINNMNFVCLTERSIGFAQCQIKYSKAEIEKE